MIICSAGLHLKMRRYKIMKFKKVFFTASAVMLMSMNTLYVNAAVKGDANGDGKFNARDAAFIANALAKGHVINSAGDYNGDGKVNIRDAAAIACALSLSFEAPASDKQTEILKLVNQERAKAGVSTLNLNTTMNKMADVRAKELITLFSHTRPDGRDCFTVFQDFGITCFYAGENIAATGADNAEDVMELWINSPGHYANMINSYFTELGVGYADGYWVQIFR